MEEKTQWFSGSILEEVHLVIHLKHAGNCTSSHTISTCAGYWVDLDLFFFGFGDSGFTLRKGILCREGEGALELGREGGWVLCFVCIFTRERNLNNISLCQLPGAV